MGWTRINIRKFIIFPWGIISCTVVWLPIFSALVPVLDNQGIISSPLVVKLILFLPEILFALISLCLSFYYPKGAPRKHNIYFFLTPEEAQNDKYIDDFIKPFRSYASSGIGELNVVLPSLIKRDAFSSLVTYCENKNIDFWSSTMWKLFHKRLNGSLYIYGKIKTRTTNGKSVFAISITPTIGYSDINKELIDLFIEDARKQIPSIIPIDREYEIEGFDNFSKRIASVSEYLLGWAHLLSGNISVAFDMHYDIVINNKPSFNQTFLIAGAKRALQIEVETMERNCKFGREEFLLDKLIKYNKLFPDSDYALIAISKWLIKKSKSGEELLENAKKAYEYISKVKINSKNRPVVHANRAYICLILRRYKEAEKEYYEAAKKLPMEVVDEIVEYCNEVILSVEREHEKTTAYYASAIVQHIGNKDKTIVKAAYNRALFYYNEKKENEYFISKTTEALAAL